MARVHLTTRDYHEFCEHAFGSYLHHTPGEELRGGLGAALARTLSVVDDHPEAGPSTLASGLPVLFGLDAEIGLDDGQDWTVHDLEGLRAGTHGPWTSGSCAGNGCSGGSGCGGG